MKNFVYRVYYEDTDSGGVVYYANYLKFYERARTDFLRSFGISQSELATKENIIFVVRNCNIKYLSPARLDDLLNVEVLIKKISATSILIEQKIFISYGSDSIESKPLPSQKVLSELEIELVCINNQSFSPRRIPQDIISKIQ